MPEEKTQAEEIQTEALHPELPGEERHEAVKHTEEMSWGEVPLEGMPEKK